MVLGSTTGRLALATGLLVLLGSACTPDPGPQPSPTPVVPTPSENAQEREQRLAYDAAEKSYRAFRDEVNRVLRDGGAKAATPEMKRTAAGSYLDEFSSAVESYEELGVTDKGIERVVYVRRGGYSSTEILLEVCEDSRSVVTLDKDGEQLGKGELRTATIRVRPFAGSWKLWSGVGKKVPSCN